MGINTKDTSDATFEADVLKNAKPVLVDFWAEWCGPCKAVAPVLEEIAGAHSDKIEVYKLDTDANPGITTRYGVTSIPTMNVYVNGEVVKTLVGALPKPKLLRELEDYISG